MTDIGFGVPDHRKFIFLNVYHAIDDPAANFEILRPLAQPAPPFQRSGAELPAVRQLSLVHTSCFHLRGLSLRPLGPR
jgi:hypothetical protein